ncbi:TonB-dependent receptor [Mucilaginibacter auburnensis]|uniref:Iron complex outermembrane receptor protein n=1 Tax=Mucilaginibacter auburnensis TaxID=1457233 RepID=A0A2H9VRS0_9SPHI|nr:TonB-dependent receptor [Mucilaginibacter auburnensis]PJJ83527.1 iron complex outermembrane receptor protein [Mucilaginibacter auburnensis]
MIKHFPITTKITALLCILMLCVTGYAQNTRGTIRGKVITANNEPAAYVSIGLEGTTHGSATNENGEFSFRAPAGSYKLIISYVGVERVEVPLTLTAGQTVDVPTITVKANQSQLSEVNVIANSANRFTSRISTDAAKIPLTPLENAQSYTTVTSGLLKEQQVFNVDEALRNAPGIQKMWDATGRAGDGGGYFTLRGFVTQTRLRNGIAGTITNTVDAVNVEKIEVIKGPSATLFGSTLTSFGGLINRVTKKPYEAFGLEVGNNVGSYDLSRTTIDLNTPLTASKNLLFRVNAAYNTEGSFRNFGKSRSFTIAPSLSYKASERLSFLVEAEIFSGRSSAAPFFFFYSQPKDLGVTKVSDLTIDYKQAYVSDDVRQRSRSINYFAQMNYKISDKFTSQTVFSSSNSFSDGANPFYYLVTDALAKSFDPSVSITPSGRSYIARYDQSTKDSKLNSIEVQHNLNGDFNTGSIRHRFVFGLDFLHQNSNQVFFTNFYGIAPMNSKTFNYGSFNQALVDATNAANPLTINNTYPYFYKKDAYSAYLSDVVNITDQLIASVGLRIDHFKHSGTQKFDRSPDAAAFNQTAFSPKFGLIYQPVKDQLSFFANYQNGFVNPDIYINASGTPTIPKLQIANQAEGGVKMALFDGKLNGTLSYYHIKVSNSLYSVQSSVPGVFAQTQDGTQVSKGFEAEIIANPFSGLNIVTGFAYNDSKYTKADADVDGLRPVTAGSPYLGNFYLSYRLPETAVKGLGVGFGGNYVSKNKIINSVSGGTFELPEYYLFNSNIFYDRTKYRVGLAVNNLTNKQYYTGYTTINPQRLRQVVLSLSYKF